MLSNILNKLLKLEDHLYIATGIMYGTHRIATESLPYQETAVKLKTKYWKTS